MRSKAPAVAMLVLTILGACGGGDATRTEVKTSAPTVAPQACLDALDDGDELLRIIVELGEIIQDYDRLVSETWGSDPSASTLTRMLENKTRLTKRTRVQIRTVNSIEWEESRDECEEAS